MKKRYLFNISCLFFILFINLARAACPVSIFAGGPVRFCAGDSVLLTASSGAGYIYEWRLNGVSIPGASGQSYVVKSTGSYTVFVVVSSPFCSSFSNSIHVDVDIPLTVSVTEPTVGYCTASTDLLEASPSSSSYIYQWYEDTLTLPETDNYLYTTGHNASYSCSVTNSCGTFTSSPYTVTHFGGPLGNIEALGATSFCSGLSVQLQTIPMGYVYYAPVQWYRDGIAIPGATGSFYTATQGGNYTLQESTSCWDWPYTTYYFYSNFIPVTILPGTIPNASITAGGPTSLCAGDSVTLSAATGAGWSYQWQHNNTNISGATLPTYAVTSEGAYLCVVSNACGSFNSNSISFQVIPTAVTITALGSTTICSGSSVSLSAGSPGSGGTWQWRLNGSNIPGAMSQNYVVSAQGSYTCAITNSCGTFVSNAIPVTVSTTCSTGLQFDAYDDYATAPNSGSYAFGTGNFTVEAWVNLNGNQSTYATLIAIHDTNSYYSGMWIVFVNGKLYTFLAGYLAGGGYGPDLRDNTCHHVAVTRTGNTMNHYIDGNLVGSYSISNYNVNANGKLYFGREAYFMSISGFCYIRGKMMEMRLWNMARTQTQLQASKDSALTGSEPGLAAYWRMNDGAGQVLNDFSPVNNDAQLGSSPFADISDPAFSVSCPLSGCTTPPAVIAANGTARICSGSSVVMNAGPPGVLSYQWKRNGTDISGATSNTYTTAVTGSYTCLITNSCLISNLSNTINVTIDPTCYTGLYFDSLDDRITIPNNPIYNSAPNFNIEAWIRDDAAHISGSVEPILSNWGPSDTSGIRVNLVDGKISWSAGPGLGPDLRDGICHRISITFNSSAYYIYVDGVNVGSAYLGSGASFHSGLPLRIGAGLNATGGTHYFKGVISEVRFWNKAFALSDMYNPLDVPASPALVGYWRFNEGAGQTATDYSSTANNGVLGITSGTESEDPSWSAGCPPCPIPSATITAGGPVTFCSGGSVTLNANTGTGLSYQWKLNNVNIGGATASSYAVTAAGNYTCIVTNTCGGATSNSILVTVLAIPSANITAGGSTTFCTGGSVTLNANTGTGLTYQWNRNGGTIAGAISSSYPANTSGNYTCVVTNICGSTTSNTITVTVSSLPPATITAGGPITFCAGSSVMLNANTGAGLTYQWKLNAGNIPGATASSYSVTAGGNYVCVVTNSCGSSTSNNIVVTVNPLPTASVTAGGPVTFCTGGSVTLNANTGTGLSYQWKWNGADISGATAAAYTANASGNYTCLVTNSCGSVASNAITITVSTFPAATITAGGPTTFCTGGSVMLNANTGTGLTYQWKLNGSNIGGAISPSFAATAAGNYTCAVANSCGNATSNTIAVTVNMFPTANITAGGPTTFCTGGSVSLSANTGAGLNYQWKLNGGTIAGATASVYTATASGNYSCTVSNLCGNSTSTSIPVIVNVIPTASVTAGGPTSFCNGGSVTLIANTGTGLSYQWTLNGGNISGATAASYAATASGNYACVVTNACGSASSNITGVTVLLIPAAPGAITGQASGLCGNTITYAVASVPGATTYTWTVPAGVLINSGQGSTFLNVTYPVLFASGIISVNATNTCGTSAAATLSLTSLLAPAGPILGLTQVCEIKSYIYSVTPVEGATDYTWTVPTKARVQHGQGTATAEIKMNRYAGNITVTASNACTTSATSVLAVTITTVGCGPVHKDNRILDAEVYPNPFSTEFTLKIYSDDDSPCKIILRDITGRLLEQREQVAPGSEITFGNHLANGIYLAEVLQGDERVVLRVVKSE